MKQFVITIIATLALCFAPLTSRADAYRDSVMHALLSIEDDSLRLRKMFIAAQNLMDEEWAVELLDSGRADAARQHHVLWELSFMGSKVRWTHRHHEWELMDRFLKEQREASFRLGNIGNYMSQIAQSVIVLSGVGMYEQAWKYIEQIKRDVEEAGPEGEKNRSYIYLAEADYYLKRDESQKCRDTYVRALKECPNVSSTQRIAIHNGLIMVYTHMGEYQKALEHSDSVIAIYYTFSVDHQRVPNSRATLVECELHKAELYMKLGQYDKMRECIEKAQESSVGISKNNIGDVYYWWHCYHYAVGNYDKSVEVLDSAVQCLRDDHYHEMALHRELDKVPSLWALGRHDEAVRHYAGTLRNLDSLHHVMLTLQQDYLAQRSEMLHHEEQRISMQLWASRIVSILVLFLFLIIMWAVVYAIYARRRLKSNYDITHRKLKEAREADMAKEQFLHDITTLIGDPLKSVVGDVRRLAADASLSPEEQQDVLRNNKKHVGRLMTLVNNVLDLSRLEAGMMKYTAEDNDLVLLLDECLCRHQAMHPKCKTEIKTDIASFKLNIDTGRFVSMLHTLFAAPVDHSGWEADNITMQLHRDGNGNVILVIMGTHYSHDDITEAEQMTNRINSLFMRDFGASYAVGYGAISIVFPASKKKS